MIIGFTPKDTKNEKEVKQKLEIVPPRKSLVRVRFLNSGREYTYYNDMFNLSLGDIVFVDGKLYGVRGRVVDISYSFKIKISDYKRVIAKADTNVKGDFSSTNLGFMSFDKSTLPFSKVVTWFAPPLKDDEEVVNSTDDTTFLLEDLKGFEVSSRVFERGEEYFFDGAVKYLCLDKTHGKAIVEGTRPYVVEFEYKNGEISKLLCDCYCVGSCKHEVAMLITLKQALKEIEENYADEFKESDYFSIVSKVEFIQLILSGNSKRKFSV